MAAFPPDLEGLVVACVPTSEDVNRAVELLGAGTGCGRKPPGRSGSQHPEVNPALQKVGEEMLGGGEDRASAGCILLHRLADSIIRPETLRMALSSTLKALERNPLSALASKNGCMALAALIFHSCTGLEGTAGKAAGRAVSEIVERDKGWAIVLKVLEQHKEDAQVVHGGATAVWALARWSKAPPVQQAIEPVVESLRRHAQTRQVAEATTAALHLLCWRCPVVQKDEDRAQQGKTPGRGGRGGGGQHPLQRSSLGLSKCCDLLLDALDNHPSSQGLLLHTCGVLMLLSLSDSEAMLKARAIRAGLRACRSKGEASAGDGGAVSEHGWGLLLVLSEGSTTAEMKDALVREGVLDAVWDVIETDVGVFSPRRHEVCWRIAQKLHAHAKAGRHHEGMRVQGLQTMRWVLPVMQEHIESNGLQELHCWALEQIVSQGIGGEGGSLEVVQEEGAGGHAASCECMQCAMGRGGAALALVSAMGAHLRTRAVQLHAATALLNLAMGNNRNAQLMLRSGAVPLVIGAMRSHMRSPELQMVAIRTLLVLCEKGAEALDQLHREGGIVTILETLRFHSAELPLVIKVLALLRIASWVHEPRKVVGQEGGIKLLLGLMRDFPKSLEVQRDACGCLHALSWNSDNKQMIVNGGGVSESAKGVRLIVQAMMEHPKDAELQQQACSALAIISYFVDDNKLEICENAGIQAIICAMEKHTKDRGIQEQGCLALWSLASRSQPVVVTQGDEKQRKEMTPEEASKAEEIAREAEMREKLKDKIQARSKKSMADSSGIQVLVTAVKEHCGGVVVVERACRALLQLAFMSYDNSMEICRNEGLQAICRAMKANISNARVLEQACSALKNIFSSLADVPKGKKKEIPSSVSDCVECALRSMRKHISNSEVQKQACSAIGSMAASDEKVIDAVGTDLRGIQTIVAVMASHSDNAEVQMRACRTLFVLCSSKSNIKHVRMLSRSQSRSQRPIDAVVGAMGLHARNAQVVIFALRMLVEVAEPGGNTRALVMQSPVTKYVMDPKKAGLDWKSAEIEAVAQYWQKLSKIVGPLK